MSDKPKVAFYWCASCGGCDEAVLDLADKLLDVLAAVDIVFWPVALDYKVHDLKAMPDGAIFAAFINGAVRTSEQQEMAQLLRCKSRVVVAFGACAHLGGVPGLANLFDLSDVLEAVYLRNRTTENPGNTVPAVRTNDQGNELELPRLDRGVRALNQVIRVDYYIPGCPPVPSVLANAIQLLMSETPPPPGSVLAPDRALCEECSRRDSKPEELAFKQFKRPQEVLADESQCLLAQGLLCMGPATRAGCGAVCISGNMPCTGCCGPTSRVRDQGAKLLSAIASAVDSKDEQEIRRIIDGIADPVGTFYRYSLPASLLTGRHPVAPH